MKICRINLIVFAASMWGLLISVYSFAQTPQSLDSLIEQACPKALGFTESIIDQHLAAWEGYRTVAGLNLVLDKHMARETRTDANLACAYILRNLALPKAQIASAMMERTRREAAREDDPWRVVYLLRQMEKMIDRAQQGKEVLPFIASFLNDKRPTEPLHRGPESVPRQQRRVCDGATSALINYMEETGLCEKYDARFGNPGGEAMWEKREQVMHAVVQVLQEKALLPVDFWTKLPPPRLPKTTATPDSNTTASSQPTTLSQETPGAQEATDTKPISAIGSKKDAASMPWNIIGVLLVATLGLLWLLLKRRS